MLTKSDLKSIRAIVNAEVKAAVNEATKNAATKDDLKILVTKEELVQFKDEILKEIETSREEMAVTLGYGERLEGHNQRISALEKTSHSHQ